MNGFPCTTLLAKSQTRVALGLLLVLLFFLAPGCVRRRLTVRSNPSGAMVYFDKQPIGTTPVSTPFVYYGPYREIEIAKGGYETEKVKHKLRPPWWQYPVIDFVTENLWPWEIRDERVVDIQLQPVQPVSKQELRERAEGLRLSSQRGHLTPMVAPAQGPIPVLPGTPAGPATVPANLPHGGVMTESIGVPTLPPPNLSPNPAGSQPYLTNPGF